MEQREQNASNPRSWSGQPSLTARDLQDVLYGIRVPIVLLDSDMTIRFFTPEMSRCFNLVETDMGMPLWDRMGLAPDKALVTDAGHVMQSLEPVEREIESLGGVQYIRRIFPFLSGRCEIAGAVVTFVDISHQKRTAGTLECARAQAEASNAAKSRSLTAACHDLRRRNDDTANRTPCFTRRQQQVMQRVLAGHPSKNIALDLGISRRTVESHRASIMKKAGVRSLPALARLAITGGW